MTIDELERLDSTFERNMFLSKAHNIFIKFFTGIMLDDLVNVRHFISDNVYEYGLNIVNKAKSNGNRQMYDELNVKSSRISSVELVDNYYQVKVYIEARYMDYLISLNGGNYVSGNNNSRIQVNYELTFTKSVNALKQGIAKKCPGCGANIDVNNKGQCEYCGTLYNQADYDWVLSNIVRL